MLRIERSKEEDQPRILTAEALAFVEGLVGSFSSRLDGLLHARREKQALLDAGGHLDFLAETTGFATGNGASPRRRRHS